MNKTTTAKKWALKHKVTGQVYPTYTYPTRSAARQAAQGRRFKGEFTPVKFMTTATKTVKKEVKPVEIKTTATKPQPKKSPNRTPKLRSSKDSSTFPIHQRWF